MRSLAQKTRSPIEADLAFSHRAINDAIQRLWIAYVDPEGHGSTSPNSFMTLRRQWNRLFGIGRVADLDGDPERALLYALANYRAERDIREGVAARKLRAEIRQATYRQFERAKEL